MDTDAPSETNAAQQPVQYGPLSQQYGVQPGNAYLILADKPTKALNIFRELSQGKGGLAITLTDPSKLSLDKLVRTIWLTDIHEKGEIQTLTAGDYGGINMQTTNYIRDGNGNPVIIEGIEYVIQDGGFDNARRTIKHINDVVSLTKSVVLLPLDTGALSGGSWQVQLLKKICKSVEVKEPKA